MPLRINKLTSNVQITGGEAGIDSKEMENIVELVLQRLKEELEHQDRLAEENRLWGGASEIEPY